MSAVLKGSISSDSFVETSEETVYIQAGAQSVSLNKDDGVLISGPLGITSSFDRIKFSGVFRFNSLIASTMPSTMVSPIPTFEMDLPMKEASGLAKIATVLLRAV